MRSLQEHPCGNLSTEANWPSQVQLSRLPVLRLPAGTSVGHEGQQRVASQVHVHRSAAATSPDRAPLVYSPPKFCLTERHEKKRSGPICALVGRHGMLAGTVYTG